MPKCDRCLAEMVNGQEYPPGFSFDQGIWVINGTKLHFTMHQADLLGVLWTRRGTFVSRSTVLRLVWGGKELRSPETNVRELVRQLRRLLIQTPLIITTDIQRGYMLSEV